MPSDDWMSENLDWSDTQARLFEHMAHDTDAINDELLQQTFNVAFFDPDVDHDNRMAAREWVKDVMRDEYGLDFDEYFDWETWRDNYGSLVQ